MIDWPIFSSRIGLFREPARSPQEWNEWAAVYRREIKFRSGRRWRVSTRAVGNLDSAFKIASTLLSAGWSPPRSVHGFIRGRSTLTGASPHAGSKLVLSVDLKDFYGQISFRRVATALGVRFDADVLAWVEGCCFMDDKLPLGFRTSPYLSNLAFEEADKQIEELARRRGITYTRWVDDLTFSGYGLADCFLDELREVLETEGWQLNDSKTRFMRRSPYVLGLYVGHDTTSPRIPRWMKKRILKETYYFARFGDAHFATPGVYPRRVLFGLCAYVTHIEPNMSRVIGPRLQQGMRRV